MTDLGKPLNTVHKPPHPCPACGNREPMDVYLTVVRWRCGHTVTLPLIGAQHGPRPAGRITQRVKT